MRCSKLGAPAAAALLACILAAGCGAPSSNGPGAAGSPGPTATPVPVHVRGFGTKEKPSVLTGTKKGRRIYVIRSTSFEGDIAGSADGNAVLQETHITFVDRSGAVTIAEAPKATVKQRDKSVFMTGGVRARTMEGAVLTCDTLRYDAGTERFRGEGHVVVTGPGGDRLGGDHLDGDVRLRDARVTSGSGA